MICSHHRKFYCMKKKEIKYKNQLEYQLDNINLNDDYHYFLNKHHLDLYVE